MKTRRTMLLALSLVLVALPAAAEDEASDLQETGFTYVATDDGRIVVRKVIGAVTDPAVAVNLELGDEELHLITPGEHRGFLGVHVIDLSPELRSHFGAPQEEGVMISKLVPEAPAAAAGVRVGDILTRITGEEVASRWDVVRQVRGHEPGETLDLEIWRDGRRRQIRVTLGESQRHVVDVGELLLPGAHRFVYDIDTEAVNEAIERLKETVADPTWQQRVLRLKTLDEDLQERLEGLEKRLLELEKQLQK